MSGKRGVRVCGATCHHARGATCRCWCGGLFHGVGRDAERERFCAELGVSKIPTTERAFLALTAQPDLFAPGGLSAGDAWRARRGFA